MASPTSITSILIAAVLCVAGPAVAQQRPTRPPVAGDREISTLPGDTVIPQEFYIERPTLKCAGFEWCVSGDDNRPGPDSKADRLAASLARSPQEIAILAQPNATSRR